jgi:hypothetical protein
VKDTPPAIERKFHRMLMERPGEERLKMGCSMHATAQALARASLSQRYPGVHGRQLKRLLFLHFYATDFEPEEGKRIASALARGAQPGKAKSSASGPVRESGAKYGRKATGRGKRSRPSSG